ncbi:unnamed protein product [Caenorhabditis auriculariae]|uniref:Peroxin-5 n=1 Tax=Caenorhabditis auriculariae TaxID=2777116 RepID=A0A8S1HQ77_9PELO|nr:unnamed protein product [Caenorhabditis auriculariae]
MEGEQLSMEDFRSHFIPFFHSYPYSAQISASIITEGRLFVSAQNPIVPNFRSFILKMKSMVEGQCGQQNALVGLANAYGTSNQRVGPSVAPSSLVPTSLGEQMASEFLQQKGRTQAPASFSLKSLSQTLPQSSSSKLANQWTSEYQPRQNQLATRWAQQYTAAMPSTYDSAWQAAKPTHQEPLHSQSGSIDSGMWSAEFLDTVETNLQQGSSSWADEFLEAPEPNMFRHNDETYEQVWKDVQNRMNEVNLVEGQSNPEYLPQETNPFMSYDNPLAEGDVLMQRGDIGNAVLAYEAAVQKEPQDAQAWCRLGLSHAENERDAKAILAFQKSLAIQPSNKEALLALSVSLANEGMENEALFNLEKWLTAFEGGDAEALQSRPGSFSSFLDHDAFAAVESRFLTAARQQGATPDPDLQNSLGVLYNLNRNYERAVESIKLAIASRSDDARLWNRLGATLANGDRTAEAISAYREALRRYPTYVRARYNLGISCMQLSTYREALEHFASALELQKGGNEESGIWSTMRSASIRVHDAPESLRTAIENRDLNALRESLRRLPG